MSKASSKATRHDKNAYSWDGGGDDPPHTDFIVDPVKNLGWEPGTWSDSAKFYERTGDGFFRINIILGGNEDSVDIGSKTNDCTFGEFTCRSGGMYHLTLKGGSSDNCLKHWVLMNSGGVVDIEIGNWSSSDYTSNKRNRFYGWIKEGGEPITYCYRLGSKPEISGMNVKHLWWRSIGLTFYWWAKYLWHVILKRPDE